MWIRPSLEPIATSLDWFAGFLWVFVGLFFVVLLPSLALTTESWRGGSYCGFPVVDVGVGLLATSVQFVFHSDSSHVM